MRGSLPGGNVNTFDGSKVFTTMEYLRNYNN
jgi:hypothetical protein